MSIERGEFEAISESDLQELVNAQVPEGLRIEYKLSTYGTSDSDKREFLKDISAFANSRGGHLIVGMSEEAGVATGLAGLPGVDPDAELLRMEQLARSGLEPRISGLRMKAVRLETGGHAIIIRVPRTWNPPHRVIAQGSNRFYVRHSAGIHEPNVEELRTLFTESASSLDQARQFRTERLEKIRAGFGQRRLMGSGRLILHIVPVAAFSGAITVDVDDAYRNCRSFPPMGASGLTPRFNYYGFINERGGPNNHGYTQVFRNGALEATKADIIRDDDDRRSIPGSALEKHIFEVLSPYILGLRDIGVPSPLIIMFTFEGVEGVRYLVSPSEYGEEEEPPLPENVLTLPECILEEYGDDIDHHRAVRPAFDALWNAIGHACSHFFNEDGRWVGRRRRN